MTWYKDGTVDVTNASATVTGTGTAFVANARIGEEFRLSGGQRGYEITAIVSDTQITIDPAYMDTTQTGQGYRIVPIKGFLKRAYDALSAAIATIEGQVTGALAGRFGAGSVGAPGLANDSDIDTGFFWPASNQLAAVSGGVQRWLLSSTALQVDVPLTGTAVMSGLLDTTAGRLMPVAAFGLGSTFESTTKLNAGDTALASGFYSGNGASATAATFPDANAVYNPFLSMNRRVSATVYGIKRMFFANNIPIIIGSSDTGATWNTPNYLYGTENLLGTVSQTSGAPTGAVIERGSNANGEYVRFADGTQICWHSVTTSATASLDWTFPAAFSVAPAGFGTINAAAVHLATFANPTTTLARIRSYKADTAAQISAAVFVQAIGRWF
jgi:hypothetical protein